MPEIKRSNAPILNPELVQAMDAMKQERNQRTEVAFVNLMKGARFLCPANINTVQKAVANPDGTVELKDQPQIQFILFNNNEPQADIFIYDIQGRLVDKRHYTSLNSGQEVVLPLSAYDRGVYTIRIKTSKSDTTRKLMR